jgi:hypothetical protein
MPTAPACAWRDHTDMPETPGLGQAEQDRQVQKAVRDLESRTLTENPRRYRQTGLPCAPPGITIRDAITMTG